MNSIRRGRYVSRTGHACIYMLVTMAEPKFTYDPITLREVADDPTAARDFADGVLAHYRASSDSPKEQAAIASVLVRWLRISGQYARAEEVARTVFTRAGGAEFLDDLEQEREATLSLELIRPALRLATAIQWNSANDPNKSVFAARIFESIEQFLNDHAWNGRDPDAKVRKLQASMLRHRAKFRLEADDQFGALRDANLSYNLRIAMGAKESQIEDSKSVVDSILALIEHSISKQVKAAGASITTETFAAGDRSGIGAVSGNKRIGPWLFWLKDGRVKAAGEYVDDQLHGPWVWFRDHGGLLQEGNFSQSLQQGHWVRYHANGRVLDQGEFLNGEKLGRWEYYNEDGSLKKTTNHKIKKRK